MSKAKLEGLFANALALLQSMPRYMRLLTWLEIIDALRRILIRVTNRRPV